MKTVRTAIVSGGFCVEGAVLLCWNAGSAFGASFSSFFFSEKRPEDGGGRPVCRDMPPRQMGKMRV